MTLIDGQPRTLAQALAHVRDRFGVATGPVLSSERP
jgi:hypothetical protein